MDNTRENRVSSAVNVEEALKAMQKKIEELQSEVTNLKRRVASQRDFVVAQYNVLAGYLGDNRQPWFLYGIKMTEERRKEIFAKFYERNEDHSLVNRGWPNFVRGILTQKEIEIVEDYNTRCFTWEDRKWKLLQKIKSIDADLLSLVECDHYDDFFLPELEKVGYGSVYKQRPRFNSNDGSAIFYHRSTFELEASNAMEYDDSFSDPTTGQPSKDRVALLAILKHVSGRRLIFISTHLARNPEDMSKTKTRARQVAQLMYQLGTFALEHDAMNVPVILAGDMNATNIWQIADISRVVFRLADVPAHPFVFKPSTPRSRPTSVTSVRKVRIDHLLLQSDLLEVVDSYQMDELSQEEPIPNEHHPSDHLPLVFRIGFRKHAYLLELYAKAWVSAVPIPGTSFNVRPDVVLGQVELRIAFEFFDYHNKRCCECSDFAAGLYELQMREKIQDLLQAIETHVGRSLCEGPLSFDEFVNIYRKGLLQVKDSFIENLREAYSFFDLDRSGDIDFDELYESFSSVSPFDVSTEEFRDVFDRLDLNKDGVVTIDEVYECLLKARLASST